MKYNKTGISLNLYKHLIYKSKYSEEYYLDIPKPISHAEFSLLSEFIFGTNIGLSKFAFINRYFASESLKNKTLDNLLPEDYYDSNTDYADVSYQAKLTRDRYFDSDFTKEAHQGSTYRLEHIFWRSVFGKEYDTTIGPSWKGQSKIYKISEYIRMKKWYENFNNGNDVIREEFIDYLQKLRTINDNL